MTTQMVVGVNPERKNNTTTNMAIGAGIGAVAGAAYGQFVPAKYNSFEALIEDATKSDKFELKELSKDASEEAKKVYNAAKEATEGYVADTKAVAELFKGDTKEVDAKTVIDTLGLKESTNEEKLLAKIANNFDKVKGENGVAKAVTNDEAGTKLAQEILGEKATVDELNAAINTFNSKAALTEEQKILKQVAEKINSLNNLKSIDEDTVKNVFGKDTKLTAEQVTAAAGKLVKDNAVDETLVNNAKTATGTITDTVLDNLKKAGNTAGDAIMAQAKNGKVTQEVAMDAAKAKATAKEGLEKFAENAKIFGTGGLKNITKWGAIGLVVAGATAWVYSKFFGNKDAA